MLIGGYQNGLQWPQEICWDKCATLTNYQRCRSKSSRVSGKGLASPIWNSPKPKVPPIQSWSLKIFRVLVHFFRLPGYLGFLGTFPGPAETRSSCWGTTPSSSMMPMSQELSGACGPWQMICRWDWCGLSSWWTNIAMENGHRNSGFSHWKWWFSIAMLNYQRVKLMVIDIPLWMIRRNQEHRYLQKKNTQHIPWGIFRMSWVCFQRSRQENGIFDWYGSMVSYPHCILINHHFPVIPYLITIYSMV